MVHKLPTWAADRTPETRRYPASAQCILYHEVYLCKGFSQYYHQFQHQIPHLREVSFTTNHPNLDCFAVGPVCIGSAAHTGSAVVARYSYPARTPPPPLGLALFDNRKTGYPMYHLPAVRARIPERRMGSDHSLPAVGVVPDNPRAPREPAASGLLGR